MQAMRQLFSLRRAGPQVVERLLREAEASELTYGEVGATRGELPTGYRHDDVVGVLGTGQRVFDRAGEGLRRWQASRGAGLQVYPIDAAVEPGVTVLVVMRIGPLYAHAACRVVYVVDDPDCFGFAYGTLPLHPARGEEAFLVERAHDGTVRFRVKAFSAPGHLVSRLGGPVSRRVQARTLDAYVRAMQWYCALVG